MKLFHYCCTHSAKGIEKSRWLMPNPHPLMRDADPLVWLTDLDVPDRDVLGLTSHILQCDRTEYRVTVVTGEVTHWPIFARTIPQAARRVLESAPGAMPMHWYVAKAPVPVFEIKAVA